MTKAETLELLKEKLSNCIIDKFYYFNISEWNSNKRKIIDKIISDFQDKSIIIRSSSICEDQINSSCAGKYHSIMGLHTENRVVIEQNINYIIQAYEKNDTFLKNQIIIQEQLKNSELSGVLFNYDYTDNSPYYVIEYDTSSFKTDTVTSLGEREKVIIKRDSSGVSVNPRWQKLINVVSEIESLFPFKILDIEFAFDRSDNLHIFQVRVIKEYIPNQYSCEHQLNLNVKNFVDIEEDNLIAFSNMADWNPIEMLGSNPFPLSISLYNLLVSKDIWRKSRKTLGYFEPLNENLISLFCFKPYVNVKLSLLSLTPNEISQNSRIKVVEAGLKLLYNKKFLHDKIEFEIALSNSFINEVEIEKKLTDYGLIDLEIEDYKQALSNLTKNALHNYPEYLREGSEALKELNKIVSQYEKSLHIHSTHTEIINSINFVLKSCKRFGVFHFAIAARLAFMGENLLKQMVENEILDKVAYNNFYLDLNTIPNQINRSFLRLKNGTLSQEVFLRKYGHLRLSTYNLLSPTYYDVYCKLFNENFISHFTKPKEDIRFENLPHYLFLSEFTPLDIIRFAKITIEGRERFKFEFTKAVSLAIELIQKLAGILSYKNIDFQYLYIEDILTRESDKKKYIKLLESKINKRKIDYFECQSIKLPSILFNSSDFFYFNEFASKPNFITNQTVQAETIHIKFNSNINLSNLKGKIILIEAMEPGFDWIFMYSIAGIITKFGGVASHLAVRCKELNIPAVIGCGSLFDFIHGSKIIRIDPFEKKIIIIN